MNHAFNQRKQRLAMGAIAVLRFGRPCIKDDAVLVTSRG